MGSRPALLLLLLQKGFFWACLQESCFLWCSCSIFISLHDMIFRITCYEPVCMLAIMLTIQNVKHNRVPLVGCSPISVFARTLAHPYFLPSDLDWGRYITRKAAVLLHTYLFGLGWWSGRPTSYPCCSPCTPPAALGKTTPSGYVYGIIYGRLRRAHAPLAHQQSIWQ